MFVTKKEVFSNAINDEGVHSRRHSIYLLHLANAIKQSRLLKIDFNSQSAFF